jgi:hypothetical protein
MNERTRQPIVLDIDHSTGPLPDRLVLPLEHWQESIRFGCSLAVMRRFSAMLDELLPEQYGTVFTGSGDFHHLSWPLIARLPSTTPIRIVVLDNHPDNMRFPFGVHCGSWVRRVAMLPNVEHVHVLGITSADIGSAHAWENYLAPLRRGRLTYWSIGVDTAWSRPIGLSHAFRNFDSPAALVEAFVASQQGHDGPAYLSIDKDVFAPDVAHTNWDQGVLQLRHALAIIGSVQPRLIGSDINGEVSHYRYHSWWKRRLSAMDEQPQIDPTQLAGWQDQQHALNLQLLAAIRTRSQ